MSDGITLRVSDEEAQRLLRQLFTRLENRTPLMRRIANVIRESVRRNFREGGRPQRWRPSHRARNDAGYGQEAGQTLVDTSRLKNSLAIAADNNSARVGTNVEYGAAHHFGVNRRINETVRAHVRTITQAFGRPLGKAKRVTVQRHNRSRQWRLPARPWLMAQAEDWRTIGQVVNEYLTRGSR